MPASNSMTREAPDYAGGAYADVVRDSDAALISNCFGPLCWAFAIKELAVKERKLARPQGEEASSPSRRSPSRSLTAS
ncbi:hypothetical protein ACLB2K_030970 [Fragaria x ananassa]